VTRIDLKPYVIPEVLFGAELMDADLTQTGKLPCVRTSDHQSEGGAELSTRPLRLISSNSHRSQ
jgi:hypothetical protein